MGYLKIHVQRGVNLAVRDIVSSDPYVVLKLSNQVISSFLISNLSLSSLSLDEFLNQFGHLGFWVLIGSFSTFKSFFWFYVLL